MPVEGLEPHDPGSAASDTSPTQARQESTKPRKIKELEASFGKPAGQKHDTSSHCSDTSNHKKCAICVQLQQVVDAWDHLPASVKPKIVKLIKEEHE